MRFNTFFMIKVMKNTFESNGLVVRIPDVILESEFCAVACVGQPKVKEAQECQWNVSHTHTRYGTVPMTQTHCQCDTGVLYQCHTNTHTHTH